jgi:hypothetical protein
MPLANYGVAIGDLVRFYRDPPDNYGHWYHGHVEVSTPSGLWTSALDVDTPSGVGVSYRYSARLQPGVLGPVAALAPGFHHLTSTPSSGAIDYLRSGFLQDRLIISLSPRIGLPARPQPLPPPSELPPPLAPRLPPLPLPEALKQLLARLDYRLPPWDWLRLRPWLLSNGDNALKALEAELVGNRKVFIFGERFQTGQGVHDVHQNQGDPPGSQWWAQNGTWQDGAVAVLRPDGSLYFWQVRFNSQAARTDTAGHPL